MFFASERGYNATLQYPRMQKRMQQGLGMALYVYLRVLEMLSILLSTVQNE